MTNQHAAPNQQTTDGSSIYNVIAVSFDDDQTAQTAMTRLQELDAQERVVLHEAVVVERRDDGQVVEADKTESTLMLGTASGGVIGAAVLVSQTRDVPSKLAVAMRRPSGLNAACQTALS